MTRRHDPLGLTDCPVGKLVGEHLYLHITAEPYLSQRAQKAVRDAAALSDDPDYNVVKLKVTEPAVSFLLYPNFDEDPHPGLEYSVHVKLPNGPVSEREYNRNNPPILHRKELFVAPNYPLYREFAHQTRLEEEAGLLHPAPPGRLRAWERLLRRRGF